MGKRVNYGIVGADGDVGLVIYANNSHPDVDPDALFRSALSSEAPLTSAVAQLLQEVYPSAQGNHVQGQRVFTIDFELGDREYVLRATVRRTFEDQITGAVSITRHRGASPGIPDRSADEVRPS